MNLKANNQLNFVERKAAALHHFDEAFSSSLIYKMQRTFFSHGNDMSAVQLCNQLDNVLLQPSENQLNIQLTELFLTQINHIKTHNCRPMTEYFFHHIYVPLLKKIYKSFNFELPKELCQPTIQITL